MHIVTEKAKHFCENPELLAHRMTCRGVPGCSVALLQGGQVTYSAVSGAAGATPVTEGTLFECASLTKPLFAVCGGQIRGAAADGRNGVCGVAAGTRLREKSQRAAER